MLATISASCTRRINPVARQSVHPLLARDLGVLCDLVERAKPAGLSRRMTSCAGRGVTLVVVVTFASACARHRKVIAASWAR